MDKKNRTLNKKNNFKLSITIIIIVIIIIIAIICMGNTTPNKVDNENIEEPKYEDKAEYEKDIEMMKNTNPGGIDIEKLDNAKIVDGQKENTSNLLLENREFEGLEFSNIKLKSINGVSNFTAIVKNNTDNVIDTKMLSLKFVDKDGNVISKMSIYIPTLGSESTTTVDASITADIINAYNFTIENIE